MPDLPLEELPVLLPHVVAWIAGLEHRAIAEGGPLVPEYVGLAKRVPVEHPEKVRVLPVERMPRPEHTRLRELAERVNVLTGHTAGLTAGYGILSRMDCAASRDLIVHELAHVAHYEALGIEGFLREYIRQVSESGYEGARFEREAQEAVRRTCGPYKSTA
ncbi:MAG TPA: hypothetical protein VGD78_10605 [Chthoniobacterales bacterium]